MSLIKFYSPQGADIYIESSKIAGVREIDPGSTYVFVSAEYTSEDWVVGEPVSVVVAKVDDAIAKDSREGRL